MHSFICLWRLHDPCHRCMLDNAPYLLFSIQTGHRRLNTTFSMAGRGFNAFPWRRDKSQNICRLHYIFICKQGCVKFLKVVDTFMVYSVFIRGIVDGYHFDCKKLLYFCQPRTVLLHLYHVMKHTALSFSSLIFLSYHSYLKYFYLLFCSCLHFIDSWVQFTGQ